MQLPQPEDVGGLTLLVLLHEGVEINHVTRYVSVSYVQCAALIKRKTKIE